MLDLLLDIHMLVVSDDLDPLQCRNLIERTVGWSRESQRLGCRLVVSSKYLVALWRLELYPRADRINRLCQSVNMDECRCNVQTVFQAFSGMLDKSAKVEDILEVDDVLVDERESYVAPEFLCGRLRPPLASALRETLAMCAAYSTAYARTYPFAVASECTRAQASANLVARFRLEQIQGKLGEAFPAPAILSLECRLLGAPAEMLEGMDFDHVRNNISLAVEWCRLSMLAESERDAYPLSKFTVGPEFSNRLSGLNNQTSLQLYRKLALLLCGKPTPGLQVEALRTSRGGSSPQIIRRRDGAKAFRMQVSEHGAGYHVHYWQDGGGAIELASIGPENDFHIPE